VTKAVLPDRKTRGLTFPFNRGGISPFSFSDATNGFPSRRVYFFCSEPSPDICVQLLVSEVPGGLG
jgi:hypothetical protein